jgi:methanogenic corrinoid protein MtbC1
MINIAKEVFTKHFDLDPRLNDLYDERRKMLMYEDILYNLGYLDTAMSLKDDQIFPEYARWIYRLLFYLMKDLSKETIKGQMIQHFDILNDVLSRSLSKEEIEAAQVHIRNAITAIEREAESPNFQERILSDDYLEIKENYIKHLLAGNTRGALRIIEDAAKSGIRLEDIYIEILQKVMHEVGDLWHRQIITIDKEHYCTSTTQMALAQFYSTIFSKPRKGLKIITCSVGSELHEMGIRMVSDLFEYNGWDSIYLGAGVPKEALLHAIEEHKPNMIGLSVTMPQHLPLCLEYVIAIREKFKNVKIAVGGRAFETTDRLWEKWDIDVYKENAELLIDWANKNITA